MIKIVVDLCGADSKESALVSGAIRAINNNPDLFVYLMGNEEEIKKGIEGLSYNSSQMEIVPCGEPITNYDVPTRAFKTKPDSSLIKGLNMCKSDDSIGGFVSCGSTGAVLVSSIFILGKIGSARPALAPVVEAITGDKLCLVDCGANVDCKPEQLVDFAHMGTGYMRALGVTNPRVALLSNGAEEKKGNEVVKTTHQLLKENEKINFVGNVEGKDALDGKCDVLVADGFWGNVLLKSIEGTAKNLFIEIGREMKTSNDPVYKENLKNLLYRLMDKYDYNSKGGAVLLGVNKTVLKGHGAATDKTIEGIVGMAYDLVKGNMVENIKSLLVVEN